MHTCRAGVGESIQSDLWSMKQLVLYTGLVPEGLFLDRVRLLPQQRCRHPLPLAERAAAVLARGLGQPSVACGHATY